jgi:CspA family cold shock protein
LFEVSVNKTKEIIVGKATGTVKFFNSQKGFGFITPDNGGKDLFVHKNSVQGGAEDLREGQKVQFVEAPGRKGPEATEVTVL